MRTDHRNIHPRPPRPRLRRARALWAGSTWRSPRLWGHCGRGHRRPTAPNPGQPDDRQGAATARAHCEAMSDDKARIEEAASSENDWVRARIIKRDPPAEGSLLKIAQRARDMAANS